MGSTRVAVASDHAGFKLKETVTAHLREQGQAVMDLGTHGEEPVDYPPLCAEVGRLVATGACEWGVVLGGSGQGEAIAANKVHGVRAALCFDETTARLARQHNDANVLALGGRVLGDALAIAILEVFMSTDFEGGRHARRVDQIEEIEKVVASPGIRSTHSDGDA